MSFWWDPEGHGTNQKAIEACKLFHRAPHSTQDFLRREENFFVLKVMSQTDFLSLLNLDADEQRTLLVKLNSRLTATKKQKTGNRTKNNSSNERIDSNNNDSSRSSSSSSRSNGSGSHKLGREKDGNSNKMRLRKRNSSGDTNNKSQQKNGLFRNTKNRDTLLNERDSTSDQNNDEGDWGDQLDKFKRPPIDLLNCAVPDSMRLVLSKSGVSLSKAQDNNVNMFYKLRTTKKVYNKICEGAHSRDAALKCGSFLDLTFPGSDRAHRLARLKQKHSGFKI
jgi:hypothetical protein